MGRKGFLQEVVLELCLGECWGQMEGVTLVNACSSWGGEPWSRQGCWQASVASPYLGVGINCVPKSYPNNLALRSLPYEFNYSTCTQWIKARGANASERDCLQSCRTQY